MTLNQIVREIVDLICKRQERGKPYGLLLLPEGLIEFVPEISTLIQEINGLLAAQADLSLGVLLERLTPACAACLRALPDETQKQLLLRRDAHGNVQVSFIETEKLLIQMVEKELAACHKGDGFSPVSHFFGYEGRAGYPSSFDSHYCYALGYAAALLLDSGASGYMCAISHLTSPAEKWGVAAVPLTALMDREVRKGKEKTVVKKALVDLQGKPFAFFAAQRGRWALEDDYLFPGPIQFFGPAALTDTTPHLLHL